MKNFRRALWDSARHWPKILFSIVLSAVAACLWGANIATLFPILDVSLRGESPQTWNERRIKECQQRITALESELRSVRAPVKSTAPLRGEKELRGALLSERTRLAGAQGLRAWIIRFLPADPFRFLLLIVAWMITATTIKQVLQLIANMTVARVSQDVARDIRHRVYDRTLEMDRGAFIAQGPSGFAVRLTSMCDSLASGVQSVFGGAISEPLRLLACLCGAAWLSWQLLLISLLFCPLATFTVMWLNRRLRAVARTTLERSHGFHHVMHEALHNMSTVQAFTMENEERNRFHQSTKQMRRLALRSAFYNSLVSPITEIFSVSVICLAITIGASLLLGQTRTLFGVAIMYRPLGVSELMVFLAMLLSATDPLRRLSGVVSNLNNAMIVADAVYPMLDARPLVDDPQKPKSPPRPHSELRLTNVTFGYDAQHPVLRDVSLSIPFGQTVAIIGANGTGKSTLVNLLCRFYDPQQGAVTLDGVPLLEMTRQDLRGRIAVVAQHTELFNEPLFYNIRYGKWDATEEEVVRAATLARAHEFIVQFPEQYQTIAGPNGMRLSGGQRQRIALARALLRNPEILILDEATSQIDVESERFIHEALEAFKGTRTILLITHRQSALRLADRVIRMCLGGQMEEAKEFLQRSAA